MLSQKHLASRPPHCYWASFRTANTSVDISANVTHTFSHTLLMNTLGQKLFRGYKKSWQTCDRLTAFYQHLNSVCVCVCAVAGGGVDTRWIQAGRSVVIRMTWWVVGFVNVRSLSVCVCLWGWTWLCHHAINHVMLAAFPGGGRAASSPPPPSSFELQYFWAAVSEAEESVTL